MESKIEKLKKWLDEKPANWWGTPKTMSYIWGKVCMLVAEEQAESHPATLEPLAVTCAKKGYWIKCITDGAFAVTGEEWLIGLMKDKTTIYQFFHADNYTACEQLARTWLEEQEDKK